MAVIRIKALDEAGVEVFGTLTEAQLRNRLEPKSTSQQVNKSTSQRVCKKTEGKAIVLTSLTS